MSQIAVRARATPVASAAIALGSAYTLYRVVRRLVKTNTKQWIESPRSYQDKAKTPYPEDFFPNGEYVYTPYGAIRMYTIGPSNGEPMFMLHGITNPSVVFKQLAYSLADRGFKVVLVDLWGRGYSDTPIEEHDIKLYMNAICYCIVQAQLTQFHLLGYAFGGCLAVSFANMFPNSVKSLILLAPWGLLKTSDQSLIVRLGLKGYVPRMLLSSMSKTFVPVVPPKPSGWSEYHSDYNAIRDKTENPPSTVTSWQMTHHKGFPKSLVSSYFHCPIYDRYEMFQQLGHSNVRVLSIFGANDGIVPISVMSQMESLMPNSEFLTLSEVGHEFPITRYKSVSERICSFVEMGNDPKPEQQDISATDRRRSNVSTASRSSSVQRRKLGSLS